MGKTYLDEPDDGRGGAHPSAGRIKSSPSLEDQLTICETTYLGLPA